MPSSTVIREIFSPPVSGSSRLLQNWTLASSRMRNMESQLRWHVRLTSLIRMGIFVEKMNSPGRLISIRAILTCSCLIPDSLVTAGADMSRRVDGAAAYHADWPAGGTYAFSLGTELS